MIIEEKKLDTRQEYIKAIDYLCGLMKDGTIQQKDKFPTERNISETLSISRNSTREALRVMESMGVMERRQGSGNYMSGNMSDSVKRLISLMLTINSISREEVYAFRRQMEKAVCTSIIEKHNENITDWCDEVMQLLECKTENLEEEVNQDKRFHFMLVERTDNRFLIILMDAVTDIYREWIDYVIRNADDNTKENLKNAHTAIINGIRNLDLIKCFEAIDRHYDLIETKIQGEN